VLICVPIDVVADPPAPEDALANRILRAFGLSDDSADEIFARHNASPLNSAPAAH
jgi:hypothetical protein